MEALKVSDKVAVYPKKPLIKKGYYTGKLIEVKPRADKAGVLVESKYGHQLVLVFSVLKDGEELTYVEGSETLRVELATLVYYDSKREDRYDTAVTANSKITKIFEALGWTFNVESTLDVDSFVGKLAELNINDLEKENEVFSVIEGIAKLSE